MCLVLINEFVQTWNYKIFCEKLCPGSLPLVLIYPRSVAWSAIRPFTQNIYAFESAYKLLVEDKNMLSGLVGEMAR